MATTDISIANGQLIARASSHFLASARVMQSVSEACLPQIVSSAEIISKAFVNGGKLLLCGNGGSAADAQHMSAEFVSRLTRDFERPALPAIALTTDSSFITAYANDTDFAGIFARQVEALGRPGDVLFAITTSGTSQNVILAMAVAKRLGLSVISLSGETNALQSLADVAIVVPSRQTQAIQESSLAIEHVICDLVECIVFEKLSRA